MNYSDLQFHIIIQFVSGLLSAYFVQCYSYSMTDIHTSIYSLRKLAQDELDIVDILGKYAEAIDNQSKQVKSYLEDHYSNFDPGDDLETYVSNPLNAFGAMKRTGYDFINSLLFILNNRTLFDFQEKVINDSSKKFPTMQDYDETCSSIALIQEAYSLNITDLRKGFIKVVNNQGTISTYKSNFNITCETMKQIATTASHLGWYDSSHIWLNMALKQCQNESSSLLNDIRVARTSNMELHDHMLENGASFNIDNAFGRTFAIPINKNLRKKKRYKNIIKNMKLDTTLDLQEFPRTRHYIPLFASNATGRKSASHAQRQTRDNFYSMCKDGEKRWRVPKVNINLACNLGNHQNPYVKLGPFLVEEKNHRPLVVLYHNILHENEIHHFKKSGRKRMARSRIRTRDVSRRGNYIEKELKQGDKTGSTILFRTSQTGYIAERNYRFPVTNTYTGWDNNGTFHTTEAIDPATCPEYPSDVQKHLIVNDYVAYNVTKRIEIVTELVLDRPYASESYLVVNYGIGGQYDVHPDMIGYYIYPGEATYIRDQSKLWYSLVGDRQSTFLIYLSTVDSGGGTVFPMLGLRSNPNEGDALFWNNINSDGTPDYLSMHGACPIVVGDKWVSNKWILYHDNFKRTPCDLKQFQPIKMLNTRKKFFL